MGRRAIGAALTGTAHQDGRMQHQDGRMQTVLLLRRHVTYSSFLNTKKFPRWSTSVPTHDPWEHQKHLGRMRTLLGSHLQSQHHGCWQTLRQLAVQLPLSLWIPHLGFCALARRGRIARQIDAHGAYRVALCPPYRHVVLIKLCHIPTQHPTCSPHQQQHKELARRHLAPAR